jgi:uncharacterized protein
VTDVQGPDSTGARPDKARVHAPSPRADVTGPLRGVFSRYAKPTALARMVTESLLQPRLDVTRITLPIAHLPPALDGLVIAHVSDFHIGPGEWLPLHIEAAAAALRASGAALVLHTGDFVQGQPGLERVSAMTDRIVRVTTAAGTRVPALAVLGNHDFFPEPPYVHVLSERLQEVGIHVLCNARRILQVRGHSLSVVGITAEDDADQTFEEGVRLLLSSPRPRIVLIHEPDLVLYLPRNAADLVLAGHTHGGQIVIPGFRGPTVRRFCGSIFTQGLYDVQGTPMYVNRGLGCTGFPFRVNSAPEVTLITLAR